MKYKSLTLKLCFFSFFSCSFINAQTLSKSIIKVDTVIMNKNVRYVSDLGSVITGCIGENIVKIGPFAKKDAEYNIKLFNEELKTKLFTKIKVFTGVSIRLSEPTTWVTFMEWHFKDEKETKIIEKKLNNLDNGVIVRPIVPTACRWIIKKTKIYIIVYSPRSGDNKWLEKIYLCLKETINQ